MDNLRAAILRPQLKILGSNRERWNERYHTLEQALGVVKGVTLPIRPKAEVYVGSSIQFLLKEMTTEQIQMVIATCRERGVELKWFGASEPAGYTSSHDSWRYMDNQSLPATDRILSKLLDMRIPLTFSLEDCRLISRIIHQCITAIATENPPAAG